MNQLGLHEFHHSLGAAFGEVSGAEVVLHYGDGTAELAAMRAGAGVFDLSFRGRLCVLGADRARFLHGQVTNEVKALKPGNGCYAALTNNKGKLQSDLNLHCFAEELLLDFEPGLTARVAERLEKFIVADDVQVVDVAPHYGLLSVQGPKAATVVSALVFFPAIPEREFQSVKATDGTLGDLYLANVPRVGAPGFDVFVPVAAMGAVADKLIAAAKQVGGCACGWEALETARIEAGVPRYGADMDESNLPQEAGIEARAVSFNKGCYIGQEVINRIRSMGQVTRKLCGLRLPDDLPTLPKHGDKLLHAGKEVGQITSVAAAPWTAAAEGGGVTPLSEARRLSEMDATSGGKAVPAPTPAVTAVQDDSGSREFKGSMREIPVGENLTPALSPSEGERGTASLTGIANIALGYVRKECNAVGTELTLRSGSGEWPVRIVR